MTLLSLALLIPWAAGIILVADTLEEAIGLSHTIHVLKDGEVQKTFRGEPGKKPSLFDLVHYMT